MFKPRHKKKTDTLEVRMPHDTKRAFIEAARAEGRTASDVVRDAIDDYLRRAARRRSSLSDRSIAMILNTPAARRSALAASAAAIGLTAIAVSPSTAEIDLQAVFERMDANGDGRVTFEEFSDHSPTPGPGGGMMVVRTVERTETDGEVVVGEGELWIPAAPDRDEAMALLEDVDVETDGAHEYRVVRRVRIEEDGETEDYVELDTSDGASFDVTAHLAAMREEEFGRFDADGDGAVDFAEFEQRHVTMLSASFTQLDANGDGRIEAEEFSNGIQAIGGDHAPAAPPVQVLGEQSFNRLDHDGDGAVTLEEYSAGPATD